MKISLAETDADIARCFPVVAQLRPKLREEEFVPRVRRMAAEKYQLPFREDDHGVVRCVAGFREMEMLYAGRTIYVDDLVTDGAARSQGHGDAMLDCLAARARSRGCDILHLDSGTQRVDAHRFYLRKRMLISCFHFELPLKT